MNTNLTETDKMDQHLTTLLLRAGAGANPIPLPRRSRDILFLWGVILVLTGFSITILAVAPLWITLFAPFAALFIAIAATRPKIGISPFGEPFLLSDPNRRTWSVDSLVAQGYDIHKLIKITTARAQAREALAQALKEAAPPCQD